MGSKALGAVNRAIVGAPIDAIDFLGRVGETVCRGGLVPVALSAEMKVRAINSSVTFMVGVR